MALAEAERTGGCFSGSGSGPCANRRAGGHAIVGGRDQRLQTPKNSKLQISKLPSQTGFVTVAFVKWECCAAEERGIGVVPVHYAFEGEIMP